MQFNKLKIMSLNVNGLNNPIRRSRVLNKLNEVKTEVIYMQETHLTGVEYQNWKI